MEKQYQPRRRIVYSVSLDPNGVEIVKEYLTTHKQTLSSWLNLIVVEFAKELTGLPVAFNKPVKKMTLEEFGEMLNFWRKSIEALESEGAEMSPKV